MVAKAKSLNEIKHLIPFPGKSRIPLKWDTLSPKCLLWWKGDGHYTAVFTYVVPSLATTKHKT